MKRKKVNRLVKQKDSGQKQNWNWKGKRNLELRSLDFKARAEPILVRPLITTDTNVCVMIWSLLASVSGFFSIFCLVFVFDITASPDFLPDSVSAMAELSLWRQKKEEEKKARLEAEKEKGNKKGSKKGKKKGKKKLRRSQSFC